MMSHLFYFGLFPTFLTFIQGDNTEYISYFIMISSYKVAAIQMNSSTDLDENLDEAYTFIQQASKNGARVAGLPENFSFLGNLSKRREMAAEIAERVPKFLSETASEFGIYLMGGSYPLPAAEGKVFNHCEFYDSDGEKLISYNKIHLFDVELSEDEVYRESDYVEPGVAKPSVYKGNSIGNWGLTVCYDLRFPELYRSLIDEGAEILSIPSAFSYTTGQDHWKALLRARAIENTSYVFAPAQTGIHGRNRKTWGHSMIIDPWGKILAEADRDPAVIYAEIEGERLQEVRNQIPSLQHRKM